MCPRFFIHFFTKDTVSISRSEIGCIASKYLILYKSYLWTVWWTFCWLGSGMPTGHMAKFLYETPSLSILVYATGFNFTKLLKNMNDYSNFKLYIMRLMSTFGFWKIRFNFLIPLPSGINFDPKVNPIFFSPGLVYSIMDYLLNLI